MWIPPPTRAGSGGNRSCVSPSRRITAAAQQGAGHCSSWNVLTGVHDFGTRRASNALWLIAIGSSQFFWRSKAAKPSRPSGCRAAAAALFDARSAPTAMSVQERRRRWHRDDSLLSDEPHERALVLVLDQVAFGVARSPVRRSTAHRTEKRPTKPRRAFAWKYSDASEGSAGRRPSSRRARDGTHARES